MSFQPIELRNEFIIKKITTIHHFEYRSDFIFKSEYHDCWSLFFIEEGTLEISFSGKKTPNIVLEKDQIFLQPPNEHFSFRSLGDDPALVFTIGFYCNNNSLDLLGKHCLCCEESDFHLLKEISREGEQSFTSQIDGTSGYYLERKYSQPFGSEQLICLYLQIFLIQMMRQYSKNNIEEPHYDSESLKLDIILFDRITKYYLEHITEHLKIENICHEFSIGRSHLQRIFRTQTGLGAIEYFCQMRISVAREYIRDNNMSLTETSKALGYNSVHYFSKQFKKITGITPSEYKNSLRHVQSNPIYQQISFDIPAEEDSSTP